MPGDLYSADSAPSRRLFVLNESMRWFHRGRITRCIECPVPIIDCRVSKHTYYGLCEPWLAVMLLMLRLTFCVIILVHKSVTSFARAT